VVKKVVDTARQWVRSRNRLRKLLDSKSARKADLDRARKKVIKDTGKLEAAVLEFEALYQDYEGRAPAQAGKPAKSPFPWRELLGAVAAGAGALEKAMGTGPSQRVIDIEAEVSDPRR
jgi:hypothetical protein